MKAVVFTKPETMQITEIPDPECASDEVVVKVAASGLCGTDLHIYRNEYMSDFPLIPGHEFGGTVVEVGRRVRGVRVGQRVAVDPNLYCGACDFCRNEQANHCRNWQGIGVTRNGAFAEYVNAPARACYPVPDSLSDAQAAFIEPLSCVIHAMKRLRVYPADKVLIIGSGPMGLLLVQTMRHNGASQIVVVEKQAERCKLAAAMGATHTLSVDAEQDKKLKDIAPSGFEIVIDATGVPAVIEGAFKYLKPRGQFLVFGVAPMDAKIQISPYDVFRNDWTILGSFALCYTFQPAIAWLESGVIDIAPLVSHTVPLADFEGAFQQFARGETLKVQVQL
jgi:2-desacetyl-2-hydroxyethyl bacteriochlorophyllide A dehydrogenase